MKEASEMDVQAPEDDTQPSQFTPPALVRRLSARMLLILAFVIAAARFFFWRGHTGSGTAYVLLLLSIYLLFMFVQWLFGVYVNEQYNAFWQATSKQKLRYLAMLALAFGLMWPFLAVVFPGIWDRL